MTESISKTAIGSVKWSVLMELVSRVASPLVFVILAALLTPADFGVLATAMIAISLAQAFCDGGLAKIIVQTKESPEETASAVFWTNFLLAVLVYGVLLLVAPSISAFFRNPLTTSVLRVAGFQIILVALVSVHQALLLRDFNFRRLFWIKSLTAVVPGLLSIPFAILGYGVWALVFGALFGQFVTLCLFWHQSPWRPKTHFDVKALKGVSRFGLWAVGESVGLWFFGWVDNLLVGRFLGTASLGIYSVAWSISSILFGALVNPILPVLYSSFSRLQDDPIALRSLFANTNRMVMALTLPMGVGLLLVGPDLAGLFFGKNWAGLGSALGILGFMMGMGWTVGINHELYRAIGRPDLNAKLMFAFAFYYLPAFILAAPYGLEVFLLTRLGVGLLAIPIHIYVSVRVLHVSPFYLWNNGKHVFLATLAMLLFLICLEWLLRSIMNSSYALFVPWVMICSGPLVYAGGLWFLDRPFVMQAKNLFRQAASF